VSIEEERKCTDFVSLIFKAEITNINMTITNVASDTNMSIMQILMS